MDAPYAQRAVEPEDDENPVGVSHCVLGPELLAASSIARSHPRPVADERAAGS